MTQCWKPVWTITLRHVEECKYKVTKKAIAKWMTDCDSYYSSDYKSGSDSNNNSEEVEQQTFPLIWEAKNEEWDEMPKI